jgi:hypothetical protein
MDSVDRSKLVTQLATMRLRSGNDTYPAMELVRAALEEQAKTSKLHAASLYRDCYAVPTTLPSLQLGEKAKLIYREDLSKWVRGA